MTLCVQLLAVPVETEVRVYENESWSCVATLRDASHKEVVLYIRGDSVFLPPSISLSLCLIQCVNVVSWKGCGQYLGCAGVEGVVSVWNYSNRSVTNRYTVYSGTALIRTTSGHVLKWPDFRD